MIKKHIHYLDEEAIEMTEAGAHGIKMRTVIAEEDGAPNFLMRVISFQANAASPNHSHPWEHETFVISGNGIIEVDGKTVNLKPGDVVYVPPGADHCFRTTEPMELL